MRNTMTLAQAVGEAPIPALSFIPGEDYDPYDEDEREIVGEAMARDMADRARAAERTRNYALDALRAQNAELRSLLEANGIEVPEVDEADEIRPDNDF